MISESDSLLHLMVSKQPNLSF